MKRRILFIGLIGLLMATRLFAGNVIVNPYFQSHMVFQQHQPIVVWGTATPATSVNACFDGEKQSVKADQQGQWKIVFNPREASFDPKTLSVEGQQFTDILVGEVWICAGQSNMVFPTSSCDVLTKSLPQTPSLYQGIRLLNYASSVPIVANKGYSQQQLENCTVDRFFKPQWTTTSPLELQKVSAVATHFSLELSRQLNTPVGVILCAVGGSAVNNWIPEKVLRKSDITASWFTKDFLTNEDIFINHRKRAKAAFQSVIKDKPYLLGKLPYRFVCEPSFLYEASLSKIKDVHVKGVVWYQGESDTQSDKSIADYKTLFSLMVRSWRSDFKNSELPFVSIQLPSFDSVTWPKMRLVQDQLSRNIPNTYMVSMLDQGDPKNIHYTSKYKVGERVARMVLDEIYKVEDYSFPFISYYTCKDNKLYISFADVRKPLVFSSNQAPKVELTYTNGQVDSVAVQLVAPGKIKVELKEGLTLKKVRYADQPVAFNQSLLLSSDNNPVGPFVINCRTTPVFAKGEKFVPGKLSEELIDRSFDTWNKRRVIQLDEARVQSHTRGNLHFYNNNPKGFFNMSRNLKSLGINTFTRHIKSADEGAWWPSSIPKMAKGLTEKDNLAKAVIDSAHVNGQKLIAYHRHMEDAYWAKVHPDWVCKDLKGKEIVLRPETPRKKLCFNSPYREDFLVRAKELIAYGVDGFYFDEIHQSKNGCWCQYCRESFERETGLKMPTNTSLENPNYIALLEYKNVIIERTFRYYISEFKQLNPEIAILIGSNSWPGMVEIHTNSHLYRFADAQKTEYSLAAKNFAKKKVQYACSDPSIRISDRIVNSHGWVMARDAAEGRPAHIWCSKLTPATAMDEMYTTIGHGCIGNLDMKEAKMPDTDYLPAFREGNRISKAMEKTTPFRHIALHYPERARMQSGPRDKVWEKLLSPHLMMYAQLKQAHLPVSIITDSELEDGRTDGYSVVIVPDDQYLSEAMKQQLKNFEAVGGTVVRYASVKTLKKQVFYKGTPAESIITGSPIRVCQLDPDILTAYFKKVGESRYVVNFMNMDMKNTANAKLKINLDWLDQQPVVANAMTGEVLSSTVEGNELVVTLPSFGKFLSIEIK